MSLIVSSTALFSEEMRRKTKVILISACVILVLFLPFARRMEIRDYIEAQDYTLIVRDEKLLHNLSMSYKYVESANMEFLNQRLLKGFFLEHEHKLILVYWTKSAMYPLTLDEIQFME